MLGGGSDIAAAIVAALEPHGLQRVVLAARDPEAAVASARTVLPTLDLHGAQWDALDVEGTDRLVGECERLVGVPDLVVCAVGALGHHAGRSMSATEVDLMVRTNFAGPAAALATIGEWLAHGPAAPSGVRTIVVLSSVAGVRPRRSNYVYGSGKAGLDAFAQGLGDALVDDGVRVLVVRPGFVRSSMTEGLEPAPFSTVPEVVGDRVARAVVSGRGGDVVAVPPLLGPMFAVLRSIPRRWWRRIAGDR